MTITAARPQEPLAALALDQFVLTHRSTVRTLAAALPPPLPAGSADAAADAAVAALLGRLEVAFSAGPDAYAEGSARGF